MSGNPFLIVSLVLAIFIFGAPPLIPWLDRQHRRLKAELEEQFRQGAIAAKAEAIAEEEREATRRIADVELAKYSRTSRSSKMAVHKRS